MSVAFGKSKNEREGLSGKGARNTPLVCTFTTWRVPCNLGGGVCPLNVNISSSRPRHRSFLNWVRVYILVGIR